MTEACAACAQLLDSIPPLYDEKTEKPQEAIPAQEHRLQCCSRIICQKCILKTPRFLDYCPYCQISTGPSSLPPQGLREPPSYNSRSLHSLLSPSSNTTLADHEELLPAYTNTPTHSHTPLSEKQQQPAEDVLHFLDHKTDTLAGLSVRYNVPLSALKKTNSITSDHLLSARKTILVPGEFYKGGVSLSPVPVEGEEEEKRKGKVRKWMVACKVSEYDVALLYLKQSDYDLDAAVEAYKDDERWELEHPLDLKAKGQKKPDVGRRRFTGQKP